MGMDVYGLNPAIHEGTKQPDRPDDLHKQKDKVVKKLKEFISLNVRRSLFENGKNKFTTESTQTLVQAIL